MFLWNHHIVAGDQADITRVMFGVGHGLLGGDGVDKIAVHDEPCAIFPIGEGFTEGVECWNADGRQCNQGRRDFQTGHHHFEDFQKARIIGSTGDVDGQFSGALVRRMWLLEDVA